MSNMKTIAKTTHNLLEIADAYPSRVWWKLAEPDQDKIRDLLNACHVMLADNDTYTIDDAPFSRRALYFNERRDGLR